MLVEDRVPRKTNRSKLLPQADWIDELIRQHPPEPDLLSLRVDMLQALLLGKPQNSDAVHTDDFRSVLWFGAKYSFSPRQAECIAILWRAWEQGTPAVGMDALLVEMNIEGSKTRVRDFFKSRDKMHPAWGTMIVPGRARGEKGTLRLAPPEKK